MNIGIARTDKRRIGKNYKLKKVKPKNIKTWIASCSSEWSAAAAAPTVYSPWNVNGRIHPIGGLPAYDQSYVNRWSIYRHCICVYIYFVDIPVTRAVVSAYISMDARAQTKMRYSCAEYFFRVESTKRKQLLRRGRDCNPRVIPRAKNVPIV